MKEEHRELVERLKNPTETMDDTNTMWEAAAAIESLSASLAEKEREVEGLQKQVHELAMQGLADEAQRLGLQ